MYRLVCFSAVSCELNVIHFAIAQHIRSLVNFLMVKLAPREGRMMCPATSGRALLKTLKNGFHNIRRGLHSIYDQRQARWYRSRWPSICQSLADVALRQVLGWASKNRFVAQRFYKSCWSDKRRYRFGDLFWTWHLDQFVRKRAHWLGLLRHWATWSAANPWSTQRQQSFICTVAFRTIVYCNRIFLNCNGSIWRIQPFPVLQTILWVCQMHALCWERQFKLRLSLILILPSNTYFGSTHPPPTARLLPRQHTYATFCRYKTVIAWL